MDQFTAHLDRGWDLVSRGDFAGAKISAEKGLELDAESPEAHNLLGFIRQSEGRPDDALEHYRQALAFDETYVEAMLNAAEVLIHGLEDVGAGLAMVDEALELAEGDDEIADAQLLKFDAYMQQGNRERASEVAKQLPEGPFENEQLDFMVGRAKFEAGDIDGSEPFLARARSRCSGNGDAHYYFGLLCESRGDRRGAIVCFLEARDCDLRGPRPPWALPQALFERQVQAAVKRLGPELAKTIDDALVVVCDLPGPEVVAEGVDPHVGVLVDDLLDEDGEPVAESGVPRQAGRVFVYQLNIEKWTDSALEVEEEILRSLEHELSLTFGPEAKD